MAHARTTIRTAIKAFLTNLQTTGANIFDNRVRPVTSFPSLNLTTLEEVVRHDLGHCNDDSAQIRELQVSVMGFASGSTGLGETLSDIADEVEEAIMQSSYIRSLTMNVELDSAEEEVNRDTSIPIGVVELIFNILYETDGNDPSTIL